jgi:preprotein translocase subunit SecA
MIDKVNRDIVSFLTKCDLTANKEIEMQSDLKPASFDSSKLQTGRTEVGSSSSSNNPNKFGHRTQEQQVTQPIVKEKKVGRNDPCPCGSGKKYKQCHGR